LASEVDWTVCRAALERAVQVTRERNIQLGLVMFPELYKLNDGYPFRDVHRLLQETCGRLGIPFLDLFDTFNGRDPRQLWVHPRNHHPNEVAHALAAEAIERFVREEFLRQPPPRPATANGTAALRQPAARAQSAACQKPSA
jgi:hypothetical protein